jgi:general secretion pathway protein M
MMAVARIPLRRIGSLALLIAIVLAVGVIAVAGFVLAGQMRSEATDEDLMRLARYEAEIAARPQLEKELRALRERESSMPGLVGGENAAVAGARLQSQLQSLIESSGGTIRSTQDLPATRRPGFEQVNVACEFTLPLGRLKDLLYGIDRATPYLFVDNAVIQAGDDSGNPDHSSSSKLTLRLTVHGYRVAGIQ